MGRRKKAAKKVAKKKKPSVARTFKCLFCNHQDVVSCKLDTKSMTGKSITVNDRENLILLSHLQPSDSLVVAK